MSAQENKEGQDPSGHCQLSIVEAAVNNEARDHGNEIVYAGGNAGGSNPEEGRSNDANGDLLPGHPSGSGEATNDQNQNIPPSVLLPDFEVHAVASSSDDEDMDVSYDPHDASSLLTSDSEVLVLDSDSLSDEESVYFSYLNQCSGEGSFSASGTSQPTDLRVVADKKAEDEPVAPLLTHYSVESPSSPSGEATSVNPSSGQGASTYATKARPHYLVNCETCQKPADFVCQGCYRSAYCSEEHQQAAWDAHRRDCVHYGLALSPSLTYRGPFFISQAFEKTEGSSPYRLKSKTSVTDTKAKEKILEEKPFLICPWPRIKMRQSERHLTPGLIVRNLSCFGCGKMLCFSWTRCGACNLFLCSPECLYISNHKNFECKIIQRSTATKSARLEPRLDMKTLHQNEDYREYLYLDVMILRLVIKLTELRESMSPEQFANEWAKLDMIWKSSPFPSGRENERHAKICDDLPANLRFSYEALGGRKKLLWKLFSVIDMNSFTFELPFRRFRTLCVVLGLAAHSCIPNCHAYLGEPGMQKMDINQIEQDPNDLTVILESGRNLEVGATLTFSYVPLTFGTTERRMALYATHSFWCMCSRCIDPSECGTFATNLKCPTCQNAMLVPTRAAIIAHKPDVSGSTSEVTKADWECRGNVATTATAKKGSSSAFRRVGRVCPPLSQENAIAKLKGVEAAIAKYSVGNIGAIKELLIVTKTEHGYFYQSALLKLCEDIIRGTFFPLPDIVADDLSEFTDQTLTAIVLAKNNYKEFMEKINPGFNFEGFPLANLELAENELLGRETGKQMYLEAISVSAAHSRLRGYVRSAITI